VDRLACVELPALPLQLLFKEHPDWQAHPTAVVDSDKPHGKILWVNEQAQATRILPGMRYAAALSLSGALRAGEVAVSDLENALEEAARCLHQFTPGVETAQAPPGLFWLDASGLEPLYASLLDWAKRIRVALASEKRLQSSIAVGFSKFGTQVIAQSRRGVTVFRHQKAEQTAARQVAIERLPLPPAVRNTLFKLRVRTVGAFMDLPAAGIQRRFGADIWQLYRLATGDLVLPFSPSPPEVVFHEAFHLDDAETDLFRLMALIARLLPPMLEGLTQRDEGLSELQIKLRFESGRDHNEQLRPAAPTTDEAQIIELVRLRLASLNISSGVIDGEVTAKGRSLQRRQLDIFAATPPRNQNAAQRALARIRAQWGDDAVVRARLREGHLPEALFTWEPLKSLGEAQPRKEKNGTLIRRLHRLPLRLPSRSRHEPDGWMLRGFEQGPVIRLSGPYVISGGWWKKAIHREYHFAEMQRGDVLWIYYDRLRRRWFLQGRVE
jgi:protein ImuB